MTRRGLGTKNGKRVRAAVEQHYAGKAATDHDRLTAGFRELADEPVVIDHPSHTFDKQWNVVFPEQPAGLRNLLARVRLRRLCRRSGGHFWHPSDPMIAWRCCGCGVERDGMPKDGT